MLKADEWHTLSTVFLPIALISMWGAGTPHFTERQSRYLRQVLDHTMLVVAAVSIAMMHTMTPTRSANFLKAMTTYLNELVDIHPHVHHLPNHHASTHLPWFFHLFGPSRAFWCLPFERLISKSRQSLSNHKLGVSLGVPTLTLIVLKQFS